MNTNNSIDIAEFFKNQLENQSVEPPTTIWDKVQNKVPDYPAKGISHWIWYSSIILAIGVASVFFIFNRNIQKPTIMAQNVKHTVINIPERACLNAENSKPNGQMKKNVVATENRQKNGNAKLENTIFHLDASKYSVIEKVDFMDSLNNLKKSIQNPQVNEFGFYALDISNLKAGKYIIYIFSKDGKKFSRTEILK